MSVFLSTCFAGLSLLSSFLPIQTVEQHPSADVPISAVKDNVQSNSQAPAQSGRTNIADLELSAFSNSSAVVPGEQIWLGVEFLLPPGWHIYAPNPGDIGKPTEIKLILPEGFRSGKPEWPAHLVKQDAGVTINCYEGKVFVAIPVSAPLSVGSQNVSFKLKVSWLACHESCVPGSKELALTIPVASEPGQAVAINADKFVQTAPSNLLDQQFHTRNFDGQSTAQVGFWWCLLLAYGGGMLLNLMPCVLPVLSFKIVGFAKKSQQKRSQIFKMGLAYTAGTLMAFLSLACTVVAIKSAGQSVGWGFQFQHPAFLLAMATLTTVMTMGLFDFFLVNINNGTEGLDKLTKKEGLTGAFFLGILATMLSTPCTAPLLGTALGYALAQSSLVIFSIFISIGLGLLTPYLVLCANPGWLAFLPKSGPWMNYLKRSMGLLMLASAAWLLWVIQSSFGNAMLAASALFIAVACGGAWLIGRHQFGPAKARIWSWMGALAPLTLAFILVVRPVMFGGRPGAITPESGNAKLNTQPFTPALLSQHLSEGRIVFLDFSAQWCLTCKINESVVLNSAEVQKCLQDHKASVLTIDWTTGDEAVTKLLAKFGRSGVPLYVIFSPDKPNQPIVLPEVITRQIVIDAIRQASNQQASNQN